MTAFNAADTFDSDRFSAFASVAAMSVGPADPDCPGVPVGRADCIAVCSALVDTPSFEASVVSVAVEKPGPLLFGGAAVVDPAEAACAAELLVLLVDEDEPQPATAPPKRAEVPTITAILRMRLWFMSITLGVSAERALGRR
jgi:hypothetical protein